MHCGDSIGVNAGVMVMGSRGGGNNDWVESDSMRRRNWDGGSAGSVSGVSRV